MTPPATKCANLRNFTATPLLMDWTIDHVGPSLWAGLLAAVLGLVMFGALALTQPLTFGTAVGCGLGTGFGTWLGNVIGRTFIVRHSQSGGYRP